MSEGLGNLWFELGLKASPNLDEQYRKVKESIEKSIKENPVNIKFNISDAGILEALKNLGSVNATLSKTAKEYNESMKASKATQEGVADGARRIAEQSAKGVTSEDKASKIRERNLKTIERQLQVLKNIESSLSIKNTKGIPTSEFESQISSINQLKEKLNALKGASADVQKSELAGSNAVIQSIKNEIAQQTAKYQVRAKYENLDISSRNKILAIENAILATRTRIDHYSNTLGVPRSTFKYQSSSLSSMQSSLSSIDTKDINSVNAAMTRLRSELAEVNKEISRQASLYNKSMSETEKSVNQEVQGQKKVEAALERVYALRRNIDSKVAMGQSVTVYQGEINELNRLQEALGKVDTSNKTETENAVLGARSACNAIRDRINLNNKLAVSEEKAASRAEREASAKQINDQRLLMSAIGRTNNMFMGQSAILRQLKQQLAMYLSIYAVQSFFKQIIQIGGEFQKQRIALQSIIGDVAKANELFAKLKVLAVESPFQFSEIASYAKQLTAFSIPYNEMYETTKRLADLSAGLGVSMDRLVLAYGQVKSAAFLRGQEVRQFTEAGIPLLDELAKKLTTVEGRAVSAGDVFKRISNREIEFKQVKEVLWDLTNEGGKFYNMQKVLADSIAGKWSNLKDVYQIMLSEIAEGNSGPLMGLITILTAIMKNWKILAVTIASLSAGYLVFKTVLVGTNTVMALSKALQIGLNKANIEARLIELQELSTKRALTAAELKQLAVERALLGTMQGGMLLAVSTWIGLASVAITVIGTLIYNSGELDRNLKKINDEGESGAREAVLQYDDLVHKLSEATKGSQEYDDILQKIQSTYGEYLGNLKEEGDLLDQLKGKYDAVAKGAYAKAKAETLSQQYQAINESYSKKVSNLEGGIADRLQNSINVPYIKGGKRVALTEESAKRVANDFVTVLQYAVDNHRPIDFNKLLSRFHISNDQIDILVKAKEIYKSLTEAQEKREKATRDAEYTFGGGTLSSITDLDKKMNEEVRKAANDAERKAIQKKYLEKEKQVYLDNSMLKEAQNVDATIKLLDKKDDRYIQSAKTIANETKKIGGQDIRANILDMNDEDKGDLVSFMSKVLNERKKLQKEVEEYGAAGKMKDNPDAVNTKNASQYRIDQIDKWIRENGLQGVGDEGTGRKASSVSTKDPLVDMLKQRIEYIEKAISSYNTLADIESKEQAVSHVSSKFAGSEPYLKDTKKIYEESLERLKNDNSEAAQDLKKDLEAKLGKNGIEPIKKAIDDAMDEIKKEIDRKTPSFDLYKQIFESTGNQRLASQLAFGDATAQVTDIITFLKLKLKEAAKVTGETADTYEALLALKPEDRNNVNKNVMSLFDMIRDAVESEKQNLSNTIGEVIADSLTVDDKIRMRMEKLKKDLVSYVSIGGGAKGDSTYTSMVMKANSEILQMKYDAFRETAQYQNAVGDVDRTSTQTLKYVYDSLRKFKELAMSQGDLKNAKTFATDMKKIYESLMSRGSEMDNFKASIKDYNDAIAQLKKDEIAEAFQESELNRLKKEGKEGTAAYVLTMTALSQAQARVAASADRVKAGFTNMQEAATRLGKSVSNVLKAFGDLASQMGDADLGQELNDIANLIMQLSEIPKILEQIRQGMSALDKASVILMVISAIIKVYTDLMNISKFNHDQEIADLKDLQKAQLEYNKSLLETKLLHDDIFGENKFGNVIADIKTMKDSMKDYYNIMHKGAESANTDPMKNDMMDVWQYKTTSYKKGFLGIGGKHSEWVDLGDYIKNLTNKTFEEMSVADQLKTVNDLLSNHADRLSESTKNDLEKLQQYLENIKEVEDEIKEYTKDLFGDMSSELSDAIIDAFENGTDAAESFEKSMSKIIKKLGKQMMENMAYELLFKNYEGDFEKLLKEKSEGKLTDVEFADKVDSLMNKMFQGAKDVSGNLMDFWSSFTQRADLYGFDMSEDSSSASVAKGIQSVTEDTAELLASYINAIRQDVAMNRGFLTRIANEYMPQITISLSNQVASIKTIEINTTRNANNTDTIVGIMKELTTSGSAVKMNVR